MNKKQWLDDMQRNFFIKRMVRQGIIAGVIVIALVVIMNVIYN